MGVGINQGGIFARAMPEADDPDVQFHFATLSSDMAGSPVHTFSGFTMSVCQLRPESRGYVHLRSRAIRSRAPAMQPNYLSTDGGPQRRWWRAYASRGRLASTPPLGPYVQAEYRPGPAARPTTTLLEFAQEHRRHHLPSERHVQDGRHRA